jgi:hypothetical protein
MALPLPAKGATPLAAYTARVARFYADLGYQRVSQQKIGAGVRLLADLVANQGYAWDDIDFALSWVVRHRDSFGGNVYSLNVLPHVIDRAREEARKERARERRGQPPPRRREEARAHARPQDLEGQINSLSESDKERLRARARESLLAQGVKGPFLEMESLVRSEMLRLLSERPAPAPAKRPKRKTA